MFLKKSRNKITWKLPLEETIFISAFNAENFMKIKNIEMTWQEFKKKNSWFYFYMKYIGKYVYNSAERPLTYYC